MKTKKERPIASVILFLSFAFLLIIFYLNISPVKNNIPQDLIAVLRPHAIALQPFTLTDKNNNPFTNTNLNGKWSFLFFGYTHCPDICPTTLMILKHINNELKKNPKTASDMQVIFISIDPERDDVGMLAKYTEYFNKEFIPLTGSNDNLYKFSKQFSASFIKEETGTPNNYLMSHTSSIFLVDPKMRLVASFSPPHDIATITSQYLKIHDMY